MAKLIDKVKKDLIGEVLSMDELEAYMGQHKFFEKETDDDDDELIKFTNYKSELWVVCEIDDGCDILISNVKRVTQTNSESSKVEPFHSYDDMINIQNYFEGKGALNHWLIGWLMVSAGRRIGDTVKLKWSDLFEDDGKYREKLTQLKEEKTGKKVAPVINQLAKKMVDEYIEKCDINVMQLYDQRIFSCGKAAFQKALREAIDYCGLNYPIGAHSYRKYYGSTMYKLHPREANNIKLIQFTFGHSDEETTKTYIGQLDEEIKRYSDDLAEYIIAKQEGREMEISNSPIVSMKAEEFRALLGALWNRAVAGGDKFDVINELIGVAEQVML